jgi:hypothetical protein
MDEALLPPAILAKATRRGNEYAWPFACVEEAIMGAQASALATLGGQAQFRIPEGTCEMYWLDADASDRRIGEPWPEFVTRSAQEVLTWFRERVVGADFLAEARQWPILREKIEDGVNVLDYLCFVLDFQAESGRTRCCI